MAGGAYALVGGLVSLAGYVFDVPRLTDWQGIGISIQPNAAACAIAAGAGIILLALGRSRPAAMLGVLIAALGGLTFLEYFTPLRFPIHDLLLFGRTWGRVGVLVPGRMGPPGSLSWTAIGVALSLGGLAVSRGRWIASLALLPLMVSAISICGYLYGVSTLYSLPRLTVIALQTATFILATSIALLALTPRHGIVAVLRRDDAGGLLLRRMLIPIVVMPLLIGWLRVRGQEMGLYDTAFGTALFALTLIVFLATLVMISARRVSQASQAVAEQGERLRTTLASIGDAVIATDLDGRVTMMNAVAEQLTGWALSDARSRPLDDVFHIVNETTRQPVENPALRALRDGVIVGLANHTVLIAKDGVERPIDDSAAPIRCAEGKLVGCVLVFRDVADRRAAERALLHSEEQKAAVLASAIDALITMDHRGLIVEFNPAAERIFGHRRADVVGKPVGEVVVPHRLRDAHREGLEKFLQTGEHRVLGKMIEVPALRSDGTEFPCELSINVIRTPGGEPFFTAFARDISERRKVDDALRKSEARYRLLFESVDEGFCTIEFLDGPHGPMSDYVHIEANPAYTANAGIPDIVGQKVREMVPAEADGWVETYRNVLLTGKPIRFERELVATGRHLELAAFRVEPPELRQVAVLFKDITARKRAEQAVRESEERFRVMADNIPQLAWMADGDGSIFWYNRRWFDYTGTNLEQMQGWGWKSVHHPDHVDRVVEKVTRHFREGLEWEDTFPLRGKDGRFRWFLSRMFPIRDVSGKVVRFFGTNTDVTDLRQTQDELERAREAAEAANNAKDNFLATLSHELRTPLTPALATLGILENSPELSPQTREDITLIRRNLDLEARLIDDLLDLTRIVKGKIKLDLEALDVHKVLGGVTRLFASDARGKYIDLREDFAATACQVRADSGRLQQAFWNLLRNAIKFTPERGRIEVRTRNDARGRVQVIVEDNGIGISPDTLKKLFTPFEQGDDETVRRYGGLGLGLAITRTLLDAQGGSIEAQSAGKGKGATFVITLPCLEAGAGAIPAGPAGDIAAAASDSARAGNGDAKPRCLRLLLVEDHSDTARAMSRLLRGSGHEVHVAETVQAALHALAQERFDVLVSDIGLPDGTGIDLIRQVRQQQGLTLPAIALTGFGMEQDVARCREAGFDDHLTKPVNFQKLEQSLRILGRDAEGVDCPSA